MKIFKIESLILNFFLLLLKILSKIIWILLIKDLESLKFFCKRV